MDAFSTTYPDSATSEMSASLARIAFFVKYTQMGKTIIDLIMLNRGRTINPEEM